MVVDLPKGGQLEVTYTPALVEQVRKRYFIDQIDAVDESLIRAFLVAELSAALAKEKDVSKEFSR